MKRHGYVMCAIAAAALLGCGQETLGPVDIIDQDASLLPTLPDSPADRAVGIGSSVTLQWKGASGNQSAVYTVLLDTVLPPAARHASGVEDTVLVVSDLRRAVTYYWQIVATDTAGESDTSDTWAFSTAFADQDSIPFNMTSTISAFSIDASGRHWFANAYSGGLQAYASPSSEPVRFYDTIPFARIKEYGAATYFLGENDYWVASSAGADPSKGRAIDGDIAGALRDIALGANDAVWAVTDKGAGRRMDGEWLTWNNSDIPAGGARCIAIDGTENQTEFAGVWLGLDRGFATLSYRDTLIEDTIQDSTWRYLDREEADSIALIVADLDSLAETYLDSVGLVESVDVAITVDTLFAIDTIITTMTLILNQDDNTIVDTVWKNDTVLTVDSVRIDSVITPEYREFVSSRDSVIVYTEYDTSWTVTADLARRMTVAAVGPNGTIWMGAGDGALIEIDPATGAYTVHDLGIVSAIRAIAFGDDNTVWLGSDTDGFVRFRGESVTVYSTQNASIPGNNVPSIDIANGSVYIASSKGILTFRE
jgi:hypothetical protein